MSANNRGFFDPITILIVLVLCIGAYLWAVHNGWSVDKVRTATSDHIDNLSRYGGKIKDYADHYKDLSGNLKDEYFNEMDVSELPKEIREYLAERKDDAWGYSQTPETVILAEIMDRCVRNGKVAPECREFVNQLVAGMIPVKK